MYNKLEMRKENFKSPNIMIFLLTVDNRCKTRSFPCINTLVFKIQIKFLDFLSSEKNL